MDKIVVLSSYGDGDIQSKVFPSLKAAQQAMFCAYVFCVTGDTFEESQYSGRSFPECLNDIKKDENLFNEDKWITEESAYFTSDRTWKEYAWSVQELSLEKDTSPASSVQTQLGTLSAEAIKDSIYPGIKVSLQKEAGEPATLMALVEVDQYADVEAPVDPTFKIHVYSVETEKDEPIFNYAAKTNKGQLVDLSMSYSYSGKKLETALIVSKP